MKDTLSSLQTVVNNLPGFVYRCANDPNWTMIYLSEGHRLAQNAYQPPL